MTALADPPVPTEPAPPPAAGGPAELAFLRRRRDRAQSLANLAGRLAPADRALVQQVIRHHVRVGQLADALGRPRITLYRRLARLRKTLADPAFALLDRFADQLEPDIRRPAEQVFFHCRSLRQAAQDTGLTLHQVRVAVKTVRALSGLRKPQRKRKNVNL